MHCGGDQLCIQHITKYFLFCHHLLEWLLSYAKYTSSVLLISSAVYFGTTISVFRVFQEKCHCGRCIHYFKMYGFSSFRKLSLQVQVCFQRARFLWFCSALAVRLSVACFVQSLSSKIEPNSCNQESLIPLGTEKLFRCREWSLEWHKSCLESLLCGAGELIFNSKPSSLSLIR